MSRLTRSWAGQHEARGESITMRTADEYLIDVSGTPEQLIVSKAESIFDAVWRTDFSVPGFCLLDLGRDVDSHDLRSLMIGLKERLSEVAIHRIGEPFASRSMGRFDQQETTKYHLDGAPERSLLMLGYEPSKVRSRLSLADYTCCAFDLGIEPRRFLDEFNPMYRKGEEVLARYVTELPRPAEGHSRILLINNSSLPYTPERANPLGVLHKAEILGPDETERRIVNSIMLVAADEPGTEEIGGEQQRAFVTTEAISQKSAG